MALISCPECKKQISDTASNCPICGYQLTTEKIAEIKKKEQQTHKGCAIGCLSVIVIFLGFYLITHFNPSSNSPQPKEKKWYHGGTLHKAKIRQWHEASYENRLATAADWVASNGGFEEGINLDQYEAELKTRAIKMEQCVTESTKGLEYQLGDDAATIAASCYVLNIAR